MKKKTKIIKPMHLIVLCILSDLMFWVSGICVFQKQSILTKQLRIADNIHPLFVIPVFVMTFFFFAYIRYKYRSPRSNFVFVSGQMLCALGAIFSMSNIFAHNSYYRHIHAIVLLFLLAGYKLFEYPTFLHSLKKRYQNQFILLLIIAIYLINYIISQNLNISL